MSDQERLDQLEAEGLKMHTPEFERDIAETMDSIFAQARRLNDEVHVRAERRERIAAQALAGLLARPDLADAADPGFLTRDLRERLAENCVMHADALLAALDAAEARDREATK